MFGRIKKWFGGETETNALKAGEAYVKQQIKIIAIENRLRDAEASLKAHDAGIAALTDQINELEEQVRKSPTQLERKFVAFLTEHDHGSGVMLSQPDIGRVIGETASNVGYIIRHLKARGMIEVERGGGRLPNTIRLLDAPDRE